MTLDDGPHVMRMRHPTEGVHCTLVLLQSIVSNGEVMRLPWMAHFQLMPDWASADPPGVQGIENKNVAPGPSFRVAHRRPL